MKVPLIGLYLLFFGFSVLAQDNSLVGSNLSPKVVPQYRTPWCYAMASRVLLNQVICEANGNCGVEGKNPDVAIAGVIGAQIRARKSAGQTFNATEMQSWFSGGDQQTTLQELSKEGRVATGSCTHEKELFSFHNDPNFSLGFPLSFQLEIIFNGFEQSLSKLSESELKLGRSENARRWLLNLSHIIKNENVLFLTPSLSKSKTVGEFVRLTLLPSECKTETVLIPPFKVMAYEETDPVRIEARIDEGLRKRRFVSLSVCASKLSSDVSEECGGHAVVVTQSELNCANGPCEKQYHFLDSSFFPKAKKNPDGSFWLPKKLVIDATQAHALYVQRLFKKIHDDLDQNSSGSMSAVNKALLNYETIVINMKVANQKVMDEYRQKIKEARREGKQNFAQLNEGQRAQLIKENPDAALYFDDQAFDKMIESSSKVLSDQLEQMRIQNEITLKNQKTQLTHFLQSLQTNLDLSSNNVIWLE